MGDNYVVESKDGKCPWCGGKVDENDESTAADEIARLTAELDEAREERDTWRRTCDQRDAESEAEILKLRDDLLTATRERNEARAEVERLRRETVPVEALREALSVGDGRADDMWLLTAVENVRELIDQHTGEATQ